MLGWGGVGNGGHQQGEETYIAQSSTRGRLVSFLESLKLNMDLRLIKVAYKDTKPI